MLAKSWTQPDLSCSQMELLWHAYIYADTRQLPKLLVLLVPTLGFGVISSKWFSSVGDFLVRRTLNHRECGPYEKTQWLSKHKTKKWSPKIIMVIIIIIINNIIIILYGL